MARSSPFEDKNRVQEPPEKLGKKELLLFLSYFRPHLPTFIADLFCAVFMVAVELLFPVISRWTLNSVLPAGDLKLFIKILVASFLLFVLHSLASYFVAFFGHIFGVLVESDMRRDIFSHIEKQSFSFFDSNRTGKLMSRVTYDLFEVSELAHHGPEDLIVSFLTIIGAIVIMLKIQVLLAVVVLCSVPVLVGFVLLSKKALLTTSRVVKEKTAEINATLESSISGIRVTKMFCNEGFENSRFSKSNSDFISSKTKYYKAMAQFHSKVDFCTHIMPVFVLAAGGFCIMRHFMTTGDLVAANLFISAFLQPIRRLTNFVEQFTTGMAGFSRFCAIMRQHEETKEDPAPVYAKNIKGDINFFDVGFGYKTGAKVLSGVNLSVKAGQMIALVGTSGGGKTTLCNLLPRFYDATEGKITLDGIDIKKYSLESLRANIGIVQQDVFLFAGSIKENIAYGRVEASMQDIKNVATFAQIADDIEKMPDKYDTIVGERGILLSGGQKQRLCIARVFLKNPPILILDEATSALDTATEQKIQASFDRLCQGRTTFVIAHRLSTIKNANFIAVIQDNQIAECGTHEQLMAKKGEYYNLYTTQYGK